MRRVAVGAFLLCAAAASGARAEGGPESEAAAVAALDAAAAGDAAGMRRLGAPFFGTLGQRGAASFEVLLPGEGCYAFLGVGGQGVEDLTISVVVEGAEVASDRISGVRPKARWCAPKAVAAVVRVVMYGGSGAFALGVYAARAPAAREAVGGAETDFIANRLRLLHAQFGEGRTAVTPVVRGNLSEGGEYAFEVTLEAGRCYTAIGVAEPSVRELEIVIVNRAGDVVWRGKGGLAVVGTDPCPRAAGTYRTRLRAARGAGQFGVQVFSD